MAKFINISNHSSDRWSEEQLAAAKAMGGDVIDVQFPNVDPSMDYEGLLALANDLVDSLAVYGPYDSLTVMIQGEMTLVYNIVSILKDRGATCVAACSARKSVERVMPDGTTQKTSVFEFVQFRKY